VAIGLKGSQTTIYPPEITSVSGALHALPIILEMNHRHIPDVRKEYQVTDLGDHHLRITNRSPYPNDALYGFIWGVIKHFKSPATHFTVTVVDNRVEDATFDVIWQD
jgi:hypothetical protein